MANPFRSSRLVYRAIEENHQDNAFFHTLLSDTQSFANFDPRLPRPVSKKFSSVYASLHQDKLLAVIICLPISSPNSPPGEDGKAENEKPIGIVGLDKIEERKEQHRNSNIFIFIENEEQGKGYGSEAIEWVLRWAFETRGLHRVGIGYAEWNADAGRLYERLGFVFEGRKREMFFWEGRWWDEVGLGMLEEEWRGKKEKRKGEKI